jgi:hypothetical protein
LLLAGASTALSLLAAEAVVRFVFRDVTTTGHPSYFSRRWTAKNPPALNRWGFREREFSERPSAGTYRIAVVGDSFTYGQGIATRDRLTELLQRRLGDLRGTYEVLNFGRPAAETVDQVAFLRDTVLPIAPHFVLLQWHVNDIEGRDKSRRPRPRRLLPSTLLHRHSALYFLANQQWATLQAKLGLVQTYEDYLEERFGDPESADSIAGREALQSFFRLAGDAGVPVGMILFPQLYAEYPGGRIEDYRLGFLMDRVQEICARNDVPCLDLRSVLAPIEPDRRLWANRLDTHPSRLANDLAAAAAIERFGGEWVAAALALQAPR